METPIEKLVSSAIYAKDRDQQKATLWFSALANATAVNAIAENKTEEHSAAIVFYTIYAESSDSTFLNEAELALNGQIKNPVSKES